jgi:isoquinoline 1-oxidoreductase beta subunit
LNLAPSIDRRTLLIGGGAGVGLVVAFALWPRGLDSALSERPGEQAFGSYLKIGRDARVTVAVPQVETGQGIWTALPQIVADELGAAWETVGVEPAPLSGDYGNPLAASEGWLAGLGRLRAHRIARSGGTRITAGSTSVRAFEQPLRESAAIARAMLVGAAAGRWNVDASECEAADGFVLNRARTFTFAELAEEAAERRPPRSPQLRVGGKARLIGQPVQRLDGPAKADGSLRFAADVRLADMLFASARLAPPGGKLSSFSRDAIRQSPGVRHISARDGWIAVAAESWWAAEQALRAAEPRFTAPNRPTDVRRLFDEAMASGSAETWFERGNYDAVTRDSRALAAIYFVAPGQHLGLEPLSATARFAGGTLEIWAPTQAPQLARAAGALAAGISNADVILYPMPVGEPAGRALEADAVPVAVALARELGRPVQLTIPQHASQNHDRVSPGALARMTALPGEGGITAAWQMRVATTDGLGSAIARLADADSSGDLGAAALDGSVPPYSVPNLRIQSLRAELTWRSGYMRGSPQREMCFFTESFVDELARAAGMEPLAFRMSLLGPSPRLARCLQAAARIARWDGGGPGSTMGLAGCSAFGSHIGLVASASIGEDQSIKVHRLVASVDCGHAVNSGLVRQQIESGLIWALAQATVAGPEWVAAMPRARAIGGIGLPRIGDTPELFVHLLPSDAPAGGVSGLGTTVLAPAVANAIFAGTGRRLRSLPFDPMGEA